MGLHFEVLKTKEAQGKTFRVQQGGEWPAKSELREREHSGADDEIAKLVQRIFVLPGSAKAQGAVAFCGVNEGAGCSWISARCAESLAAQVTGNVCLIDANWRSPAMHAHFHMDMAHGFVEAMSDSGPTGNFTKRIGKTNLWLITSGVVDGERFATLNPARLRALFSELRTQFDYLLIDTPAVASYPEGVLLAQMADGAVLVVGSNSTRRESARIVKENLDAARVPVLGVVLNRRTYPIPEGLYRRL
jgi:Mrp family chromosome partitioning ATPase